MILKRSHLTSQITLLQSLYTNMSVFENYDASKAYSSVDDYFWKPPSTGDVFVIIFEKPIVIKRIKVNTGTEDRQNDILHHGALDVGGEYSIF